MTNDTLFTRREAIALLGAAGLSGFRFPMAAPFPQWGLQLYTVRSAFAKDVPGTLAAVAKVGYREVETAGYGGKTPADFRKMLDDVGLKSPSAHVDLNAVDTGLAQQLENCATIGHTWLVVPSLPRNVRSEDGLKKVAETFSRAAEVARKSGVRIAYHNHDVDFAPVGNSDGMSILLDHSSKDVAAELDVYWIVKAGGDPFAFITKYKQRVKMLHLKDASPAPELGMRAVGEGTIDWVKLLPAAKKAGVQHVFVEHDNPSDAMASIASSYGYLSKLK